MENDWKMFVMEFKDWFDATGDAYQILKQFSKINAKSICLHNSPGATFNNMDQL